MSAHDFCLEFMAGDCAGNYKNLKPVEKEIVVKAILDLPEMERWQWVKAFNFPVKKLWFSVDVEMLDGTGLEQVISAIRDQALKQFDGDASGICVWDAKFLNNVTGEYQ
jgi:hypothetical protein